MHILIPKGTSERSAMWTLMDLITQQIVLQKKKKKKKKIDLILIQEYHW